MKLGFAFLTLSLVVPQATIAQTDPCLSNTNELKYWCSTQGKCVANQYACTAGSTTSAALTTDPCVNNPYNMKYWCSMQGKCVANQYACTVGSTSTSTSSTSGSTTTACSTDPNSKPYLPFWCESLQNCKPSASYCPTGYTPFTGPKALKCDNGASCVSTAATRSHCPNDRIFMGHYYLLKANGIYSIGEGCTVNCKGCVDSGMAPVNVGTFTSGQWTAPGYTLGTTGTASNPNTHVNDNNKKPNGHMLRGA